MKGIARRKRASSASLRAIARPRSLHTVSACACLLLIALAGSARGQSLPAAPITTAGGRLTIGGEASAAVAPSDEYYFNYSDYNYDLLRQVRADASAVLRLGTRFALLGDLRVEGPIGNGPWTLRPYAAFARIRPWSHRAFDVQAGLIPPVFGAFSRHSYGADNPLIGFPLAYQYLTSLRPDALPASADDLLRMRGRGWLARYPVGNLAADHGVPLVDGLHYQAGVEVHAGNGNDPIEVSAALTAGSMSVPHVAGAPSAPQVSGRFAWRPSPGLVLGVSGARGVFVAPSVTDALGSAAADSSNDQRTLGFDAEYSRGHWLVRTEGVLSSWRIPALAPPYIDAPLRAFGIDVEGRYRILPGLYAAARVDHLGFSHITGSAGELPWDAPVRRIEAGGGYSVQRNVLVKFAYQYNWRDSAATPTSALVSAQVLFWF
jgi:hypothetical protein